MAANSKTVFNRWMRGNGRKAMMSAINKRRGINNNPNNNANPTPTVPRGFKVPGGIVPPKVPGGPVNTPGPLPPKPEGPVPNVPRTVPPNSNGNSKSNRRPPYSTPPIINRGNYR